MKPTALELLRHDAAHVMAQAVQELYPGTQVTIGPAIENGFYYDFARAEPFTPDDLDADRGADARDRQARSAHYARGLGPRRRQAALCRAAASTTKLRSSTDIIPAGEDGLDLSPGRLVRCLPRPASARAPASSATASS